MKRLCLILIVVLSGHSAWAIPTLQLDIAAGGVWDPVTETTFATSNPFTLRALMSPSFTAGQTFYLSAAIVPGGNNPNFGSFDINGTTYSSSAGMQYGTPPADADMHDLGRHGVFPTWYAEVAFSLNPGQQVAAYNVQDHSGGPGSLYYVDFTVNIAGLFGQPNSPFALHFDLYTYDANGNKIDAFAPFSHDAESGHGITILPQPRPETVPDGGMTFGLLAGAVVGLLGFRRMVCPA